MEADQPLASQHIDGLMQERRNSSPLAMELRLSCINPLIWNHLKLSIQFIIQFKNSTELFVQQFVSAAHHWPFLR